MNKFMVLCLFVTGSLCAWEDHPDNDNARRDSSFDSTRGVEGGYDWSNRDREGRDDPSYNSSDQIGTITPPDRDR